METDISRGKNFNRFALLCTTTIYTSRLFFLRIKNKLILSVGEEPGPGASFAHIPLLQSGDIFIRISDSPPGGRILHSNTDSCSLVYQLSVLCIQNINLCMDRNYHFSDENQTSFSLSCLLSSPQDVLCDVWWESLQSFNDLTLTILFSLLFYLFLFKTRGLVAEWQCWYWKLSDDDNGESGL